MSKSDSHPAVVALLPCPFCGGTPQLFMNGMDAIARCGCGITLTLPLNERREPPKERWFRLVDFTTAAWNKRAEPLPFPGYKRCLYPWMHADGCQCADAAPEKTA